MTKFWNFPLQRNWLYHQQDQEE